MYAILTVVLLVAVVVGFPFAVVWAFRSAADDVRTVKKVVRFLRDDSKPPAAGETVDAG
jgi:hypothetical protein